MQMAEIYSCFSRKVSEKDVVEALKSGDEGGRSEVQRRIKNIGRQLGMNEMIESSALKGCRYDRIRVQESCAGKDNIFSVLEDVERLRREQDDYVRREFLRVSEDVRKRQMIWSAFYCLRDDLRKVLALYYIEKRTAEDISDALVISKATFWRRRKEGVSEIVRCCGQSPEWNVPVRSCGGREDGEGYCSRGTASVCADI